MAASTLAPRRSLFFKATTGVWTAAATLAIAALAGCGGDGRTAGAGEFGNVLLECQDRVFQVAMAPVDMEFLDDESWHMGDLEELRIGGLLSMLGPDLQPKHFEYECLVRNGRIINSKMV